MTPVFATIVVFGQSVAEKAGDPGVLPTPPPMSGLPADAIGGGITFSLLAVAIFLGWLVVKHYGHKLTTLMVGICIGVLGAGGFIGALAWSVIRLFVTVASSVGHAV